MIFREKLFSIWSSNANWSFFEIYLDKVLGFGIYPGLIKVGFPLISVIVHWKIVLKFLPLVIIRFPEYHEQTIMEQPSQI